MMTGTQAYQFATVTTGRYGSRATRAAIGATFGPLLASAGFLRTPVPESFRKFSGRKFSGAPLLRVSAHARNPPWPYGARRFQSERRSLGNISLAAGLIWASCP